MASDAPAPSAAPVERNLRLLPWWWVLRWTWFGESIWVIYLTRERGLTLGEVFLFESAFSAVVILAEVPTGVVADRYGRRIALLFGTIVGVSAFFAFGFGVGLLMLLGAYTVLGVAEAFQSGADNAMLFDTLDTLGRGARFTSYLGRYAGLQTAAMAVFTIAGSALVHWFPLSVPIILSGIASAPAIVIAWRTIEPPRHEQRPSFVATGRAALANVRQSRPLWAAILLLAVGQAGIVTMGIAMQPVVLAYGVPLWTLGIFVAAQLVLSTVGSLAATPVRRLLGLRATLLLMPVLGALSLLAGASRAAWLFPLFVMPSITFNVLYVLVVDFVTRRAPEDQRATTISIASMIASLANVGSTAGVGALVDAIGLGGALTTAGVVGAALGLAVFVLWVSGGDTAAEPTTVVAPA